MRTTSLLAAWVAASLLASPLGAQPHSEGPFLGAPMTMLVAAGTADSGGPLALDRFHRKRAGFGGWLPEGPPLFLGDPEFSTTALFGGGVAPPAFEINAYSLGLDEVLATTPAGGVSLVAVPPGAWGAVSFSVARGSPVAPGTVLAYESAQSDGMGADIFSWMLPGSAIPIALADEFPVDRPQRALDSTEMDLFGGGSPGELIAFDIYSPMFQAGPPLRPLLPDEPTVFFSVSHDAVFPPTGPSAVPVAWFGATPPSPGTILKTSWNTLTGSWLPPSVHLTFAQLGLGLHDDVDALAVDQGRSMALFSIAHTAGLPVARQLQVAAWSGPIGGSDPLPVVVSVGEYRDGGLSAAERVGLVSGGEIDGVCTVDPGEQLSLGSLAFGSPALQVSPDTSMGSQTWRDEATTAPTITSAVSNVPVGPFSPPRFLQLWLGTPAGTGYVLLPEPVVTVPLDGSNPDGLFSLPLSSPSLGAMVGLSVDLIWVVRPATPKPSAPVMRILI